MAQPQSTNLPRLEKVTLKWIFAEISHQNEVTDPTAFRILRRAHTTHCPVRLTQHRLRCSPESAMAGLPQAPYVFVTAYPAAAVLLRRLRTTCYGALAYYLKLSENKRLISTRRTLIHLGCLVLVADFLSTWR